MKTRDIIDITMIERNIGGEHMSSAHYEDCMRDRPPSGEPVSTVPNLSPERRIITGCYCSLEPLDASAHAIDLYAASHGLPEHAHLWDWLPVGPFDTFASFQQWIEECARSSDPLFYAVRDPKLDRVTGMASYLNIHPEPSRIEIGHIMFGTPLQRTPASTEALYLLMDYALTELGFRRLEWKCNALNGPSRSAANRLGFRYEGTFYQHQIVKGHNRDTAWYSILDREWSRLRTNFEQWLSVENFDDNGNQRVKLSELNKPVDR